jgi:hypothetical protein
MATKRSTEDRDGGIDYIVEGATPPHEKDDSTNAGYDEAAHTGPGRYGVLEGQGGVFGTTGGGSYGKGMHVEERPVIETEKGVDERAEGVDERAKGEG